MGRKYLSPLNLLRLSSPPSNPEDGDMYFDTSSGTLRIYSGGAWRNIGPSAGGGSGSGSPDLALPGLPRPAIPGNTHYVIPYAVGSLALTTLAATSNAARFYPFAIYQRVRITSVAINVSTAGAGQAHVGIYSSNPANRYAPSNRLYLSSNMDTDTTGTKVVSGLNWTLDPGIYWIALWTSGTPTLRAVAIGNMFHLSVNIAGNNASNSGAIATGLTAGLPDPAPSAYTASNTAQFAIGVQYDIL